jgi:hypothetical protein
MFHYLGLCLAETTWWSIYHGWRSFAAVTGLTEGAEVIELPVSDRQMWLRELPAKVVNLASYR